MNSFNQNNIYIIIFILIIFIIYHFYITYNICSGKDSLDIFTYQSEDYEIGDIVILIIGGTHGDEPAGSLSIKLLQSEINLNKIKLKKCKLILVPSVNYCGLKINFRFVPEIGDINRKYPINLNEKPSNNITKNIINLVKKSDFILDLHEGWGFHRINNKSIGSTITPTHTFNSNKLAFKLIEKINENLDGYKRFKIITSNENLIKKNNDLYSKEKSIKGTLSYYCNLINKDYILIETTGKNNIQPINIRVNQNYILIKEFLQNYNLI